jgi:hypothetical protein
MARSIPVLHVEDEPDFADLASTYLQREDDRVQIRKGSNPDEDFEIRRKHDKD